MRTQQVVAPGVAVAWTVFVWAGRIRNALADDALAGATLAGVVVLSLSSLVLAAVAAMLTWRDRNRAPGVPLRRVVLANTLWASVIWAVRVVDIAFAGDHDAVFIAVHVGLAVVSVGLWFWALRGLGETHSEEIQGRG